MFIAKLKSWLIHKLGGATSTEVSTILSGYASHPVQFGHTEYPIHTLSCEFIAPDDIARWTVSEREAQLCHKLAELLVKSDLVNITTMPSTAYSSVIRATVRVVSPSL